MKKDTLFWDVDTQYDFMRPEGRLYVPGAEGIIDNVSRARHFALDNGYSIIASADWHKEGNQEISTKPDFKTSFPSHCIAGKPGSERVGNLGKVPIDIIPNQKIDSEELQKILAKKQFHIEIRKEEIDPFTNPNTKEIIQVLKPRAAVLFGVALDLCVRMVVYELLGIGGIKIYLLKDAVRGLGVKGDGRVLEEFIKKGVEMLTLAEMEKKF